MITVSCRRIVKGHKIHLLFATAHTRAGWLKPARPVEPKYETRTLLMKGPCQATPAKPASVDYKACLLQVLLRVCVFSLNKCLF